MFFTNKFKKLTRESFVYFLDLCDPNYYFLFLLFLVGVYFWLFILSGVAFFIKFKFIPLTDSLLLILL